MKDELPDLNRRIASKAAQLRAARGLSLDALATRSGVSRSMISLIERAETSPTAVVLERLAAGLGATLGDLFDSPATDNPVSRRKDQATWTDPQSGYTRRNVSPSESACRFRLIEVNFPAGARVAFETAGRAEAVGQQVWVLSGRIDVTIGATLHALETGDCLTMRLEEPTMFHNPGKAAARYVVAIDKPLRP